MSGVIELKFEAPKGSRIHKGFLGITTFGKDIWWSCKRRAWVSCGSGTSSTAPCNSLKAFRRHLRKHAEELRGAEVVLVSRWMGCDIIADLREPPHD